MVVVAFIEDGDEEEVNEEEGDEENEEEVVVGAAASTSRGESVREDTVVKKKQREKGADCVCGDKRIIYSAACTVTSTKSKQTCAIKARLSYDSIEETGDTT